MTRDMELIRKIVHALETHERGYAPSKLTIEGYSDEQIGYHAYLTVDAGLATGFDSKSHDSPSPYWFLTALTSRGHDFAEMSRNDTIWRRVITLVKEKGGSATVSIVTDLLKAAVKAQFSQLDLS